MCFSKSHLRPGHFNTSKIPADDPAHKESYLTDVLHNFVFLHVRVSHSEYLPRQRYSRSEDRGQWCCGKVTIGRDGYLRSWTLNYRSAILLRILQVKEIVSDLSPKKCHVFISTFSFIFEFRWPENKPYAAARAYCPPARSPLPFLTSDPH